MTHCVWETQHIFSLLFSLLYTWPPCLLTARENSACSLSMHSEHQGHSSQLQLWLGVCSHSLVLMEIPEAPGFTDNIRNKRMQNRSSEYFPEENGLLAIADLAWPLEQGLNVGIWLRERTERPQAVMETQAGGRSTRTPFLIFPFKFSQVSYTSSLNHSFIYSFNQYTF